MKIECYVFATQGYNNVNNNKYIFFFMYTAVLDDCLYNIYLFELFGLGPTNNIHLNNILLNQKAIILLIIQYNSKFNMFFK